MTIFLSDAPRRMLQAAAIDVAGTAMSGLAWGARALRDRRAARKTKKRSRDVPPVKDLDALDG